MIMTTSPTAAAMITHRMMTRYGERVRCVAVAATAATATMIRAYSRAAIYRNAAAIYQHATKMNTVRPSS